MRDVLNALPDLGSVNTDTLAAYGWSAVAFALTGFVIYANALTFSHLGAFHTARNMKSGVLHHLSKIPMGYFSSHSSGEIRKRLAEIVPVKSEKSGIKTVHA